MSQVSVPDPLRPDARALLLLDAEGYALLDGGEAVADALACAMALRRLVPDAEVEGLVGSLETMAAALDPELLLAEVRRRFDPAAWERPFLALMTAPGRRDARDEIQRLGDLADAGALAWLGARWLHPDREEIATAARAHHDRVTERWLLRADEPLLRELAPYAAEVLAVTDPDLAARSAELDATLRIRRVVVAAATDEPHEPTTEALSFTASTAVGGLDRQLEWANGPSGLGARLELVAAEIEAVLRLDGPPAAIAGFDRVRLYGLEAALEGGVARFAQDLVRARLLEHDGPALLLGRPSGSWESF